MKKHGEVVRVRAVPASAGHMFLEFGSTEAAAACVTAHRIIAGHTHLTLHVPPSSVTVALMVTVAPVVTWRLWW